LDTLGFFGYQLDFQIRYDKGAQTVWRRNPSVQEQFEKIILLDFA